MSKSEAERAAEEWILELSRTTPDKTYYHNEITTLTKGFLAGYASGRAAGWISVKERLPEEEGK